MELTCWPRSFPVGKVCPNSSGCITLPRYLPVSYSDCHTVTWPDTVHPAQGSQYRSFPWKAQLVDFYFFFWEQRWLVILPAPYIDVRCFLQVKRPSAGQPCFLRMRKCNKPVLHLLFSNPEDVAVLVSSAQCCLWEQCPSHPMSVHQLFSGTLPMLQRSLPGTEHSRPIGHESFWVFSFLLRYVLCCPQCSPTLSFSVPTA